MARTGRSAGSRIIYGILSIILVGAFTVWSTLFFGNVRGEEFSPFTFKRRTFTYFEIPLLGIQVSPIQHDDTTSDLESHLVKKSIVTASTAKNRWDLVDAWRSKSRRGFGEAQILCFYLDAVDENGSRVWLDWTTQHPQRAQVAWPVVARLAREELYVFIPPVMRLARSGTPVDALEAQIAERLGSEYLKLARNRQQLELHEQAVELYSKALEHVPDMATALEGRAAAQSALGNHEDAAADRARARESRRG